MKSNLVLIGFMGVGKTSVGRRLAELLDKEFIDTDQEIEKITGLSIAQIFNRYGEVRFRSEESLILSKIAQKTNCIISTGGGAVLNSENTDLLKKNGILVCLTALPQKIQERVSKRGGRPLLHKDKSVETIKKMLAEREAFYNCADFTIDTTDLSMQETIGQLLDFLKREEFSGANPHG